MSWYITSDVNMAELFNAEPRLLIIDAARKL